FTLPPPRRGSTAGRAPDLALDFIAAGDAKPRLYQPAVAVDQKSGGQGPHAVGVVGATVGIQENRVGPPEPSDEFINRPSRLLPVDAHNRHRVRPVDAGLVLEVGHLGPAWYAPGGPEVE